MSEPITLQPGAHFTIENKHYELVGRSTGIDGKRIAIARINADQPIRQDQGVLHQEFPLTELTHRAIVKGPFGERFPYATYAEEKYRWEKQFGFSMEIPNPPRALVEILGTLRQNNIQTFEPHFIPKLRTDGISLKIRDIPVPKPKSWGNNDISILSLFSGKYSPYSNPYGDIWTLIDTTKQHTAQGYYADDPLFPLLKRLNKQGKLPNCPDGKRVGLSYPDVHDTVLTELGNLVHLHTDNLYGKAHLTVPNFTQYMAIGHLFHPEWAGNHIMEWTHTPGSEDLRFIMGADTALDFLANLDVRPNISIGPDVGFRPMFVFPMKSI